MARVTINDNVLTGPAWAGDFFNREHLLPGGAKLIAAEFTASDAVVVTVGAAGAAAGATSIPVDALSGAIPSGTILSFGTYAPVTVTVAITTAIGAVAIDVDALTGPIPAGTFLDFGVEIARVSANAAAGAVSIAVDATETAIESTDTALFPGGTKQARLTAAAAAAATSLTVDELQFALVDDETATYSGSGSQLASVVSGTAVGRTFTERAAGTGFGVAVAGDDEVYLVAFDVTDVARNNDVELYRYGGIVKENLLPNFATLASGVVTKLRANYQTTRGTS